MLIDKQTKKEILKTHKQLIDAVFHQGADPSSVLHEIMSPDINGFGTGKHEVLNDLNDYFKVFDNEQLPDNLEYDPLKLTITLWGDTAIVHGTYEFSFKAGDDDVTMYIRLTLIYQNIANKWRAVHLHGSEPSAHLAEGETWPIESLKGQNEELKKKVDEKTTELAQKNNDLLVEVALEKVRSRTMAMHKSEELAETAEVMHQQLVDLGIKAERTLIAFPDETMGIAEFWSTNEGGTKLDQKFKAGLDAPHQGVITIEAWKQKRKSLVIELEGKKLTELLNYYRSKVGLPISDEVFKIKRYYTFAFFSHGWLTLITNDELSVKSRIILERFGDVFNLTYTRFLDLQKAEAQAREAQIEAALERVRSSAMAMHKSDDLHGTVTIMFEQFQKLNLDVLRCGVGILNKNSRTGTVWATSVSENGLVVQISANESFDTHPLMKRIYECWQKKEDLSYTLQGQDLIDYYKAMEASELKLPKSQLLFPKDQLQPQYYYAAMFNAGGLYGFTDKPFASEDIKLMKRFAAVINLTYNRFLDLQKAEAQAREAQIELGLERVRARAMAMQNSDELKELIGTLFTELTKLDLVLTRCVIMIYDSDVNTSRWWMANSEDPENPNGFNIKQHEHPPIVAYFNGWRERQLKWTYVLEGPVKKDWDVFLFNETELKFLPDFVLKGMKAPDKVYLNASFNNFGNLTLATLNPLSDEHFDILLRFAKVFDLTYTRFNDLQKAEAQAREAKIEASLERVRTQTAAMNKSFELEQTVSVIFSELDKLELETLRCGIGIFNKTEGSADIWTTTKTQDGYTLNIAGNQPMDWHPMLKGTRDAFDRQQDFSYVLQGEELDRYYKAISSANNFKLPESTSGLVHSKDAIHYYYCTFFHSGGLYFFTEKPFTEEVINVIRRFANAFSLAYKRFEDLKQSEERTLEAIKASSLDRIRAEIASMRTTEDLNRITPLVWRELTILEVPFFRCGVFIIDEINAAIKIYLSSPDGHSLGVLNLQFAGNPVTANAVEHWRKNMVYTEHWKKEQFLAWMQTMINEGQIKSPETYQGATTAPESLDMHFVPFAQGMLYVGNNTPLATEKINLVKSLAEAFSMAYARYEDFNRLEAANQQIEKTLVDLKQAQSQLIQSEKMASLGELTAGIAHEIQNPLNFVNNFSDVNKELLDELQNELAIGNKQEAMSLANDIKENEQKINHHGKRADAIVKGMLQHSRKSSDKKEPVDINALADEYLRLSYHGLRAKDKSFNANFKTDFDEGIPKVDIVPQDIGRVFLNLYNNAFYAASLPIAVGIKEGFKSPQHKHEPTVWVSTKKESDKIIIRVRDNGPGIPQIVLEKIFQPFFTTKPTGQGTGLGLSLSYDIVKAHGGEILVETKEGEGSEFIILLPLS